MIHRAEHTGDFSQVSNSLMRDISLSDGARSLLIYMLSMSDEWNFSLKSLVFLLGWSEKKVGRLVKELKDKGYIAQSQRLDDNGKFLPVEWDVFEVPHAPTISRSPSVTLSVSHAHRESRSPSSTLTVKRETFKNINIKEHQDIKNIKDKEEGTRFVRPTLEQVTDYCKERQNFVDPQRFIDYYTANGWKVGKNSMKDWKAAVRTWEQREKKKAPEAEDLESELLKMAKERGAI